MPVTKKQVEEFENNYKKFIFDSIHSTSSKYTELILNIKGLPQKYTGPIDDLPNIAITFNNKLVELSRLFKEAGTSIYSNKIEDYGVLNLNMVDSSIIGEAIMVDMFSIAQEALAALKDYVSAIGQVTNTNTKPFSSLRALKNFFLQLYGMFSPSSKTYLSYTCNETEKLNSYLRKYTEIDEQLWKYNLEDNLLPCLVKYITQHNYSESQIPGLLEESIIPDLQKLGLMHLVPELQQELSKSQAKQSEHFVPKPSWELPRLEQLEIQTDTKTIAERYSNPENLKKNLKQNQSLDKPIR